MTIVENADHTAGKICRACGLWKSLDHYSRRLEHGKPTGDGYQNACKPCRSAAEMARYRANGETSKARLRTQYITHREKRLAAMQVYRRINRERVLAQKRLHWSSNRDRINALRRDRYVDNPEPRRQADRAYYIAHRTDRIAYARAYRKAHPDMIRAVNNRYYRQYRDKFYEYVNRRRARKLQADGFHTEAEWETLKAAYNYTCLCCGRREPEATLTRDHVIPLNVGGNDSIDNIQPLCKSCNSRKSTKVIDYRPTSENYLISGDMLDSE